MTGTILTTPYDPAGLVRFRAEKDRGFREEGSPIPSAARRSFSGLRYYPPAPELVFRLPLVRFPRPAPIEIGATKGDVRKMSRYGTFSFPVRGRQCTLTVYKSEGGPDVLFIPFRDATNGKETYEVGRYLDLEEHRGDEPYVLDFNLAYNPYCAYNPDYTCPLVPKENILPVEIDAGEKLPPTGGH
jgi:uncharacterized protein (DUF1684 family)